MDRRDFFVERRKHPRYSIQLPLEYWQTDGACCGGLVGNLSEGGLLVRSLRDMPVGTELNVRIFFPNGYEFDGIRVIGKIVWEGPHYEMDWKGYEYGFEIVRISREDREKLVNLLRSPSILEEFGCKENTEPKNPPEEKPALPSPPTIDRDRAKEGGHNGFWERFKTRILHPWSELKMVYRPE